MSGPDRLPEQRLLFHGIGVTNAAAARASVAHGRTVVLSDDGVPDRDGALSGELGVEIHCGPDRRALAALVGSVDAVLPAPGLPDAHMLFDLAESCGRPVLSEFDLAGAWDDRPLLAVTGTNGKTTVTTLVEQMLVRSGRRVAAAGNLEVPLVAAVADPGPEVFVVEASSFRLARSRRFTPRVGTWLNFAEDHLDVHRSVQDYRTAKARIWAEQSTGDTAVFNAEDPVVADVARSLDPVAGPDVAGYGLAATVDGIPTDYHQSGDLLVGPGHVEIVEVAELWRALPHDRSNALAAAATARAGGATLDGVRAALREFRGLAHRVELVGQRDGVRWYDDSKATAPHATLAALSGFDSVVLVAGGRNKGLDLGVLRAASERVVAVVGIGESGPEVVAAFPAVPGRVVDSMADAVQTAADMATAGDVVLLSPGCASFDWYASYSARGDDFAARVRSVVLGQGS